MKVRCRMGLHRWSRWDAVHRWCLDCRKMETTAIGDALVQCLIDAIKGDKQ